MSTTQHISQYARSGYPAVAIATSDEDRAVGAVLGAMPEPAKGKQRFFWKIAASGGLQEFQTTGANTQPRQWVTVGKTDGYTAALAKITTAPESSCLILLDFQHVIKTPAMYRALRDSLLLVKAIGTMIVMIAPSWTIPSELEHDLPVINEALPTRDELNGPLNVIVNATQAVLDEATRAAILDAASGLTLGEAESAIALAWNGEKLDPQVVANEKMKQVRQSGYLEVSEPVAVDSLGGLGNLRTYVADEVIPMVHDIQLAPRGLCFVGVPGTGKSLAAKVIGAMLGWPVLRCDIAALKSSKVGGSEQAMREVLKLVEAVSPCVFYLDEVEKAIGGVASSAQSDGGTLLGMVGALLTWLQEHRKQVLTIATCNDYSKLPPEFTRAGRFDSVWFVNVPSTSERVEIALVHLKRFGAPANILNAAAGHIADLSANWTGAEIEQLVKSAARRTKRKITREALTECAMDIRPIAIVQKREIEALQAFGATLKLANTPEVAVEIGTRKVRR